MNFFTGKRILVTGGAGFVGSNLLCALLAAGAKPRATLHKTQPAFKSPGIEYIMTDLLQAEDCAACCQDMDIVCHCAAVTSGAAVIEEKPLSHLTPNVIMNTKLLEASHAAGVGQFMFISSNTVYPVTEHAVKEDEACGEFFEKYFIVGWMKYFTEQVCAMYATKIKKPMATLVLRPANLYGPGDNFDWETSHVLPALIRKVVERMDPVPVWGDGKDVKDFLYIDDFVTGALLALEWQAKQNRPNAHDVFNIASGRGSCLRDLLAIILELDGFTQADVVFDASKPTMIPRRIVNAEKAARVFGWEPKTDIKTGLAKTIEWYRSQI